MTDKIVVLSTCANHDEAARIARSLVEQRLAACVNIVPGVRSFYRWKGEIEDSGELLLVIKTSRPLLSALQAEIERLHSYDLPEALALQVVDGSERYLEWLSDSLKQSDEPR
jgi:periplasmic divalent cation tolerance protein